MFSSLYFLHSCTIFSDRSVEDDITGMFLITDDTICIEFYLEHRSGCKQGRLFSDTFFNGNLVTIYFAHAS